MRAVFKRLLFSIWKHEESALCPASRAWIVAHYHRLVVTWPNCRAKRSNQDPGCREIIPTKPKILVKLPNYLHNPKALKVYKHPDKKSECL